MDTPQKGRVPPEPLGPSVLLLSAAIYRLLQRQMRASGDFVEIAACLGKNGQCVNGFEVSRVEFRPQVFGGMELADL